MIVTSVIDKRPSVYTRKEFEKAAVKIEASGILQLRRPLLAPAILITLGRETKWFGIDLHPQLTGRVISATVAFKTVQERDRMLEILQKQDESDIRKAILGREIKSYLRDIECASREPERTLRDRGYEQ